MRIGFYTLGCKVSQYETEAIAEKFASLGYEIADFGEVCDAYVINTCTVTAESDRKSRQIIRRAIGKNPGAVIAAVGCYTQRDPRAVAAIPGVNIVIGTDNKLDVVKRVDEMLREGSSRYVSAPSLDGVDFEEMTITKAPRTRAYIKIEDGCEAKCSYCAISNARGPVRSKRPEDVIKEVRALYLSGVSEVVLTGIETGSYGRDFDEDYSLADLILELDREGIPDRIRLGSLAPELIGEEFCTKLAGVTRLCPHFHLSMQSGSTSVLNRMRRRYTREMALKNVERLKSAFPGASFTTDLMVGFPGESEEEFLDTLSLVTEVGFIGVHAFAYSRREGTPAADFPGQLPESVKRERSKRLIEHSAAVRDEVLRRAIDKGEPLNCILETYEGGSYTAHSDEFFEVVVEAEDGLEGELVKVHPVSNKNGVIYGKIILD